MEGKLERLVEQKKIIALKKGGKKSYRKRINVWLKPLGKSLFLNGIGGSSFIHFVFSMAANTLLKIPEFL